MITKEKIDEILKELCDVNLHSETGRDIIATKILELTDNNLVNTYTLHGLENKSTNTSYNTNIFTYDE